MLLVVVGLLLSLDTISGQWLGGGNAPSFDAGLGSLLDPNAAFGRPSFPQQPVFNFGAPRPPVYQPVYQPRPLPPVPAPAPIPDYTDVLSQGNNPGPSPNVPDPPRGNTFGSGQDSTNTNVGTNTNAGGGTEPNPNDPVPPSVVACTIGCPQYNQPVCSYKGVQYPNACHANCYGVSIRCFERCNACSTAPSGR